MCSSHLLLIEQMLRLVMTFRSNFSSQPRTHAETGSRHTCDDTLLHYRTLPNTDCHPSPAVDPSHSPPHLPTPRTSHVRPPSPSSSLSPFLVMSSSLITKPTKSVYKGGLGKRGLHHWIFHDELTRERLLGPLCIALLRTSIGLYAAGIWPGPGHQPGRRAECLLRPSGLQSDLRDAGQQQRRPLLAGLLLHLHHQLLHQLLARHEAVHVGQLWAG